MGHVVVRFPAWPDEQMAVPAQAAALTLMLLSVDEVGTWRPVPMVS